MADNSGGLLDFASSPAAQGLLAAAFGGLAGARRGAPANTLGIAGLAGLTGYQSALTRNANAQYRDLQAQQIQASLKKQQMAMDMASRFMNPGQQAAQNGSNPATQGQSQTAGGIPMSLNDAIAYNMLDLPNGSTVFDAYKYGTQPQERKSGSYYVDPRTGQQTYMAKLPEGVTLNAQGQAMQVPGASASNAAYQGQEAGAVAAAQFPYNVAQNRAQQVTQAQLDPMQAIGPDGNSYFVPRLTVATGQGDGQGGSKPFMAGRNPTTQAANQDLNKNWVSNSYQPTLDAGKSAQDLNNSIGALRNIDLKTGWGTDALAGAANVLTGLGMAPDSAKAFASDAQKFQSVAMDRLMTTLMAQKGPQTEGDAQRASQTFTMLKNTPEANSFILDFAQAKANQDQRKAAFYQDALPLAQQDGDLSRVDREWRKIQGSIWNDPALAKWKKQ